MTALLPNPDSGHAVAVSSPRTVEAAIRTHLQGLWRYLRAHGVSAETAEELAQETFAIAVQKGALAFDPPATAVFLRRTARFLLLAHRRKQRGARHLADAVDELWQRDCALDEGNAAVEALRRCVGELTDRAQRAIRATYGLGSGLGSGFGSEGDEVTRHDALAAELGLQPNGLKTLLQRARRQLRECVERRHR